jgi:[ribosomal protein S18]-alanine N-acetyltransferase
MRTDLHFSDMRRRDLRSVLSIERTAFPEPWSLTIFTSELALREGRAYRVVRSGRRIVGYLGLMFTPGEAHITTIAVREEQRRHGVGTALMLEAVRVALANGAHDLSLEVAVSNERAQALYRRFGFVPVGVRKNYYQLVGEDALVEWAYGIDTPEYAARMTDIEAQLRSRA